MNPSTINRPGVVVITGSSSGIGRVTASYLLGKGYRIYGLSRTQGEELAGLTFLRTDITDPHAVDKSIDEIKEKEKRIDILINVAGMGVSGSLEAQPDKEAREQLEVNFWGTVHLCRAVIPVMRKQKAGVIINISSIGGMIGLPYQGYYSASKFAVEGFSEALYMELRPFGIRTYLIGPGDFNTGFTQHRKHAHTEPDDYSGQYKKTLMIIEKDETGGEDPLRIARKIEKLIRRQPSGFRYIVSDPLEKMVPFLKKILPFSIFSKIISGHYGLKG